MPSLFLGPVTAFLLNAGPRSSSEQILKRGLIHHLFDQHLHELRVLSFKRLRPLGIGDFHTTIVRSRLKTCASLIPCMRTQIVHTHARQVLLENTNDLRFAKTASLHRPSPRSENRLPSNQGLFRGADGHVVAHPQHHLQTTHEVETSTTVTSCA